MASPADKHNAMFQSLTDTGDQVALKGILRGSATQKLEALPMDSFAFPEFKVQGRASIVKPKDENTLMIERLQAKVAELEGDLSREKKSGMKQAAASQTKGLAQGLEQGLLEGETKAAQAFQAQIADLQSEIAVTLESMKSAYSERVAEVEKQAVNLALGISKRLFSVEAETHPERIASVISEGFAHLGQAETVVLHLNPHDVTFAQETRSLWQPLHSSLKTVRIEEDSRVERGGCWIESEGGGTIDLRAQVQWDRMEQAVRAIVDRMDGLSADATTLAP